MFSVDYDDVPSVSVLLTLSKLTCIREVLGSNPDRDTDYPNLRYFVAFLF
jgi:hypothetical protein